MANKQNFKPEEWTKILESAMLAGMADPALRRGAPARPVPRGFMALQRMVANKG